MDKLGNTKRVRHESDESDLDSPEVKRLREDLLGNIEDSDLCTSQDLDLFMKSFEEEISSSPPVAVVDVTSDIADSQPELGYLLEASDDELGLPPSTTDSPNELTEFLRAPSGDSVELSEMWRFADEQIPSYDSFEFRNGGDEVIGNGLNNGEYVSLDGLFDYSDLGFGSYDTEVPLCLPETTPTQ